MDCTKCIVSGSCVEVGLSRAEYRVRHGGGKRCTVTPRHVRYLVGGGNKCRTADNLARDVEHRSAGVRMHSCAKEADGSYGEACFLQRLPDGAGLTRLARIQFPCRK